MAAVSKMLADAWDILTKSLVTRAVTAMLTVSMTGLWLYAKDAKNSIIEDAERNVTEKMMPEIDSLKIKVKGLEKKVESATATQQEFFGAMMDAFPQVKASVEERAKQNQAAADKKRETERLLDALTHGDDE